VRNGPLSPKVLLTIILLLVSPVGKRGYRLLLEWFWDQARGKIPLPAPEPVSPSALCQARRKLAPEAVRALVQAAGMELLESRPEEYRWRGLRTFAVDGSCLSTQRSRELWRVCGAPHGGNNPQVRVSTLYALVGQLPVDVSVGPYNDVERRQLGEHLALLKAGDLIVLDRGYPSFGVFKDLLGRGLHFAMRVTTTSTFKAVEHFVQGDCDDAVIEITAPHGYTPTSPDGDRSPVRVRAVRLVDADGEIAVVLTTLPQEEFSREDIAELYHLRWGVEEHYKTTKAEYFGERQPHAKTFDGVKQELYAQALLMVITRSLIAHSEQTLADPESTRHVTHQTSMGPIRTPKTQVNVKGAVFAASEHLVQLLLDDDAEALADLLARLAARIHRSRTATRPGRSYRRVSYAPPRSQWTSKGKRGRDKGRRRKKSRRRSAQQVS